jgi:eukaryotic-like serine/threonine-protein kinase
MAETHRDLPLQNVCCVTEKPLSAALADTVTAIPTVASTAYAILTVVDRSGRRIERDVLRPTTIIGSARGSDWRLRARDVAPAHCLIVQEGDRLTVRDLGSAFGTRVNHRPVQSAALHDGDRLQLGRHELRVNTNLPGCPPRGVGFDGFRVTEILGSGGMCWVFGAEEHGTGECVALKVLPSRHTRRMLAHFRLEARAGWRLEHPHVIRVQRQGKWGALHYLVMEPLHAISLQELVERSGPLPWPQACSLIRQVALGLQHAHDRGVVHRDVKPGNVLCTQDGHAKLIDFGLAMLTDDEEHDQIARLYADRVLGTADYISPEQSHNSHAVDGRTDLYSLGCVLHLLLTGQPPFPQGTVREKIRAHRETRPRAIRERRPEVPAEVERLLLRLLAKRPEDRPATAREVADELTAYAESTRISFDWSAVLTRRLATARRRLEKLNAQGDDRNPGDSALLSVAALEAPIPAEVALLESLLAERARDDAEAAQQAELWQLWPQMSAGQRREWLAAGRTSLEAPRAAAPRSPESSIDRMT